MKKFTTQIARTFSIQQQQQQEILQFQKQVQCINEIKPLISNKFYKNAAEKFNDLQKIMRDLKGLQELNKYISIQASCFNYAREYKDAEICYLNILEYMKSNIKEYPEEEYIDQQIVLLNHYLYTDITNAELLFKELEEKSYEKMTHKQQSEFDLMKSSAYFLNETKSILQKGFPYAIEVLNNKYAPKHHKCFSLNNIAQAQLQKISLFNNKEQELQFLNQEIDTFLAKDPNFIDSILKKVSSIENNQVILQDILESGPVELLLIALSMNSYNIRITTIEDIIENQELFEKADNFSLNPLQTFIELFYKCKRKEMKKLSIDLLQLQYNLAKKTKKNEARSIILYSAFFFDYNFPDQAEILLKQLTKYQKIIDLSETDYYDKFNSNILFSENPHEDYYQIQGLQILEALKSRQQKFNESDKIQNQRKLLWMHCGIQKYSKQQIYQDVITPYILAKNKMVLETKQDYMQYANFDMKDIDQKEFEEFCNVMGFK